LGNARNRASCRKTTVVMLTQEADAGLLLSAASSKKNPGSPWAFL
jgi:hypothetical protein